MLNIDNCYNMDCTKGMAIMKEQGLKADWCIADPPYGINAVKSAVKRNGQRHGNARCQCRTYSQKQWDDTIIDKSIFDEIATVSNEQIIWGGELLHAYFATYEKLDCLGQTTVVFKR